MTDPATPSPELWETVERLLTELIHDTSHNPCGPKSACVACAPFYQQIEDQIARALALTRAQQAAQIAEKDGMVRRYSAAATEQLLRAEAAEARLSEVEAERDEQKENLGVFWIGETKHLREQIEACAPFMKDGETPAECIARNRKDTDSVMTLVVREKYRAEAAEARLLEIEQQADREIRRLKAELA